MALNIQTFDNHIGGNVLYKALAHPKTSEKMKALFQVLVSCKVAIYDPQNIAEAVHELYPLTSPHLTLTNIYGQNKDHLGKTVPFLADVRIQPIPEIVDSSADTLLILAFNHDQLLPAISRFLPPAMKIYSLDDVQIDALTGMKPYLAPLNFATNYAFFREKDGFHTRLTTVNYWHRYGAKNLRLSCILFGEDGHILAEWDQKLGESGHTIVLDSQEIKRQFGLDPFIGQLFIQVIGAKGHDIVKYALDTYGEEGAAISCTHDANSWPAETYGGLPAPQENEDVYLWIQNNHAVPIPAGGIGLNIMGGKGTAWLNKEIAPFATHRLSVSDLLPGVQWPRQIEMQAGKYVVRPRYEIVCRTSKRRCIAHVNVQRNDLKPTILPSALRPLFGKSYLLPAPILPQSLFRSFALPTPMGTTQTRLPLKIYVYDASGREVAQQSLGILARDHTTLVDCSQWHLSGGYGHMELAYDADIDIPVDGWLHGLFRYERGDQMAETSFGAHIFNTALVYQNEPQSYAGAPPGLRTRLFLPLAEDCHDTVCFLIYPASTPWHPQSETTFILADRQGTEISQHQAKIPCSGSYLFSYYQAFSEKTREAAKGGYIIVQDTTCRLFGYHGTWGKQAFSLDHMFGF